MSRCFPYPPPGYYGNGATLDALIESIKLQKETDKTKADRKKEKKTKKEKKEKRRKEKSTNEDPHKLLQNSAQIKKTKAINELLEKSDLTQEDGQPISSHQPSYSSDSTQNSNKRKRDDYSLLLDSSNSNGSFKIRLLKKQKGSDSANFVADARSNTHPSVSFFNSDRSLVSCNGKNDVSASRTQIQTKSSRISKGTTIGDTNRVYFSKIQSVQSTRPQQQVCFQGHLEHEIPSSSVSRITDEQRLYSGRQHQFAPSNFVVSDPLSNKTTTSAAGKPSINEVSMPANGGLMKQKQAPQKVGLTRAEKKMLKKHVKYEKLIGSWLPPVLQANLPDDDWLSSKTSNLSVPTGEVETCREAVASWQPCARFLAEVDMHALPYTVPF